MVDSDSIFPQYASETLEKNETYAVVKVFSKFGQVGDIITVLDLDEKTMRRIDMHSGNYLEDRVELTFLSREGIQKITFPRWGSLDHTLMSYLLRI